MQRDNQYLLNILESAKLALYYVSGSTREEFEQDIQRQDAVIRRLEIIGEADRRITQEAREKWSALPWHAMIGMRNFVIHKYDAVDYRLVWDTVQGDLPELIYLLAEIFPRDE